MKKNSLFYVFVILVLSGLACQTFAGSDAPVEEPPELEITEAPIEISPTDVPPTDVPPTVEPPTEVPPTEEIASEEESVPDDDSGAPLPELINGLYLVDVYDFERDPFEDLAAAVEIAGVSNKMIILEVGGDWCPDCHNLKYFIEDNHEIREALASQYIIVKVNLSNENRNEDFIGQYPDFEWVPHFAILDSSGEFVRPLDTRELMSNGLFDAEKFWAFIDGTL